MLTAIVASIAGQRVTLDPATSPLVEVTWADTDPASTDSRPHGAAEDVVPSR